MSNRTESKLGNGQDPATKEEKIMAILKMVRNAHRIGDSEIAGWKELAMKGIIDIDELCYRLKAEEQIIGWFRQNKDSFVQRILTLFKGPASPQRNVEMMRRVNTITGEINTAILSLIGQMEVSREASRVLTKVVAGYVRSTTEWIVHEVKFIIRTQIRAVNRNCWNS